MVYKNIAHATIQDRRSISPVPCGPGGMLHDYVPFYFAPRSPMLYTISRGNVEGHEDGQQAVVHLVSSVQKVQDAGLDFVFTDGHGIMVLTEFFENLDDLDQVDWEIMNQRYWFDTGEDTDRKRRRQAEFLVHTQFPWNSIEEIAVMNEDVKIQVGRVLAGAAYKPDVVVRRAWYY